MKLGSVSTVNYDDIAGQAPDWYENVLRQQNQFQDQATIAIRSQPTFAEVQLPLTHNQSTPVKNPFSSRPKAIFPGDTQGQIITGFTWAMGSNGSINVLIQFGASIVQAGSKPLLTTLILMGD